MKHSFLIFLFFMSIVGSASSCDTNNDNPNTSIENNDNNTMMGSKIKIRIGSRIFTATLYDNATATAFKAQLPMTIPMKELNGDEKFYDLPERVPTNASNPGTIKTGDLMLFGSSTLVLFYKTFSTSYSYTRLGRIDNSSGLAAALGSESVTVTFEVE